MLICQPHRGLEAGYLGLDCDIRNAYIAFRLYTVLDIEHGVRIKCPMLFVKAMNDDMVTSEIVGMVSVNFPDLAISEVDAGSSTSGSQCFHH